MMGIRRILCAVLFGLHVLLSSTPGQSAATESPVAASQESNSLPVLKDGRAPQNFEEMGAGGWSEGRISSQWLWRRHAIRLLGDGGEGLGADRPEDCSNHRLKFSGRPVMDDTAVRRSFTQPTHIHLRRCEAWRAVFVEGRAQKELDIQYHSMRQWVDEFRRSLDAGRAATAVPPPSAMLAASACEDIVIGCTRADR